MRADAVETSRRERVGKKVRRPDVLGVLSDLQKALENPRDGES